MAEVLFEKSADELHKYFKDRFKIKPPWARDLTFQVFRPGAGDIQLLLDFYQKNAPDLVALQDVFVRPFFDNYLLSQKTYVVSVSHKGEMLGCLLLVPPSVDDWTDLLFPFYQIVFQVVKTEERRRGLFIYMCLCAFLFAKKVLELKVIVSYVYPKYHIDEITFITPLSRSLKNVIERLGKRQIENSGEQYNYERLKLLYHVFEEIFNLKLSRVKGVYYCYVVSVSKLK